MRFLRNPFTITAVLVAVTAYAAPKVIWDPAGEELQFKRKTGATTTEIVGTINTTPGDPMEFNQGVKVTAGKPLIADSIETNTGAQPPGMVPVGGTVMVFPHLDVTNAWQPPATGVIKDGFMRADGNTVPSGQGSPLQGKTLPDLVGKFAKGGSTSGGTGGSNTHTPTGTVSQPTFAGAAVARSTWFGTSSVLAGGSFAGTAAAHSNWFLNEAVTASFAGSSTTYTVSVPGHSHGFSLAASLGLSGSAPSLTGTTTFVNSATHSVTWPVYTVNPHSHPTNMGHAGNEWRWKTDVGTNVESVSHAYFSAAAGTTSGAVGWFRTYDESNVGTTRSGGSVGNHTTGSVGISGGSYSLTGSNTVTGTVGSGSTGDAAFNASGNNTPSGTVAMDSTDDNKQEWAAAGSYTPAGTVSVTMNTANDNMAEWSAAGSYTPTGTVSQPSFVGDSQNTEPAYVTGVWVIRVK